MSPALPPHSPRTRPELPAPHKDSSERPREAIVVKSESECKRCWQTHFGMCLSLFIVGVGYDSSQRCCIPKKNALQNTQVAIPSIREATLVYKRGALCNMCQNLQAFSDASPSDGPLLRLFSTHTLWLHTRRILSYEGLTNTSLEPRGVKSVVVAFACV